MKMTGAKFAGVDGLMMLTALSALPPGQRQCVVLRYYQDLSEAQTAALLGIAVGTVKSQAARGLARLASIMEER